jgi:hypothetical protein
MSEGFDSVDVGIRAQLEHALGTIDIDLDAQWERLRSDVGDEQRRSAMRGTAVAASLLLLALSIGRPVVDAGAAAAVRFVSELVGGTVGWVLEGVEDAADELSGRSSAHGPVDEDDEYAVAVRSVHQQLNEAVGWDKWDPDELEGADARLLEAASDEPELEERERAREAAALIRTAREGGNRDDAVQAHRIVEDIERRLRQR